MRSRSGAALRADERTTKHHPPLLLQFFSDLTGGDAGSLRGFRVERDCRYNRMAATSITFTNLREVVSPHIPAPRIPSHRDLHPSGSSQETHAVIRLRKEMIRNK